MKKVNSLGALAAGACAVVLSAAAEPLDATRIVEAFESHYAVLLATADKEGTAARPVPYSWADGRVVFVEPENWCSGFFAGTLWRLYEATGREKWKEAAIRHTEKLERIRHFNEHHDVGFMLMTSYGNAWRHAGDSRYAEVLRDGAMALVSRYRLKAGLIQSWGLWSFEWHCPVIIDNMMNLELLEWAADNAAAGDYTDGLLFDEIARAHADATDRNHFRIDGSAYHLLDYDPSTGSVLRRFGGQGYDAERGVWSRGQAWAVNGFAMMYRETHDPKYLARAVRSADWALAAPGKPTDRVAYWDYFAPGRPDTPRDAAGASVLASGLVELSNFVTDDRRSAYLAEAKAILESLSRGPYFAEVEEVGGFAIKHCVGSYPVNSQIDIPMNYADYYFLDALLRYQTAIRRMKIVLDADVSGGADDAVALAVLNALSDLGECEPLGVVIESDDWWSVRAVDAVNSQYGRVQLPVGCPKGRRVEASSGTLYKEVVSDYSKALPYRHPDNTPDAVATYRRLLAGQTDGTVTICSLGSGLNLRDLLASGPDGISSLDGRTLVARKVCRLVALSHDGGPGGQSVPADWPTPVAFAPTDAQGPTCRNVTQGQRARTPVRDLVAADKSYSDAKGRAVLWTVRGDPQTEPNLAVDQLLRRRPRK